MSTALIKDGLLFWHLTEIRNLESILKKGLLCRNTLKALQFVDIADKEIIEKRTSQSLGDYVPFHFFCKNPFDGNVIKNNTGKDFIYITIKREVAKRLGAKIIPEHPLSSQNSRIMPYDQGFDAIDWESMEKRDFTNSVSKHVCMAECVIRDKVDSSNFHAVYTKSKEDKNRVESLFSRLSIQRSCYITLSEYLFV